MIKISKEKEFNLESIFGKEKVKKWIKKYPILVNKDVESWLFDKIDKYSQNGKDPSKFTLTTYINQLQSYCKYNQVSNPTELLQEEIDSRNLRVKKYLTFLLNGKDEKEFKEIGFNKKPNSVSVTNMIQSRIKSFYSSRGVPISFGMDTAKSGVNKNELNLTGEIGKDIVKKIKTKLESPEFRLIVQFQTQLGLRINDVLEELKTGNYSIEKYKEHYFIPNFRTMKYGIIINYLFFTKELTELLQTIYNIDDLTKLDLTKILKTNRNSEIDQNSYLQRLKEVMKDLGIEGNLKTHTFRKYFSSQVRQCKKLDSEFKEHLMGHTSFNLSQAYNNNFRDIEWFYSQWKMIETLVCVDCIIYDRTNAEVLELKEKNRELDNQINELLDDRINTKEQMKELSETVRQQQEAMKKQQEMLEKLMKKFKN